MFHSLYKKTTFGFLFTTSLVALAGCQTAQAPAAAPVPLVEEAPVKAETTVPVDTTLEQRVSVLEGKMRRAEPTLKKVDLIENHFQALSLELKMLSAEPSPPASASVSPEAVIKAKPTAQIKNEAPAKKADVKKAAPKPEPVKSQPAVSSSELAITSMRIGAKDKKVMRLVMDATRAAEMRYDLDNGERLLVIELPKAEWKAVKPVVPKGSELIQSVEANASESGSRIVIQLKGKAKIVATGRLNPSGDLGHRVYLDIAPSAE